MVVLLLTNLLSVSLRDSLSCLVSVVETIRSKIAVGDNCTLLFICGFLWLRCLLSLNVTIAEKHFCFVYFFISDTLLEIIHF